MDFSCVLDAWHLAVVGQSSVNQVGGGSSSVALWGANAKPIPKVLVHVLL